MYITPLTVLIMYIFLLNLLNLVERMSSSSFRQLSYPFLSLCNFVFFQNIVNYCVTLPKANSTSILLFLTAVVALRINKCIRMSYNQYPIEFPMEVFLVGVLMPPIHALGHLKCLLSKKNF